MSIKIQLGCLKTGNFVWFCQLLIATLKFWLTAKTLPWLLCCGGVAIGLAVSRVLLAQSCNSSGCVQLLWFPSAAVTFISFQLSCFHTGAFGDFGSAEGTSSGLMGEWGQCLFRAARESQFTARDWTLRSL